MKNKKQNIVAKYARKFVKAVTMRDRTKYSKKVKHKGEERMQLLDIMQLDSVDLLSREGEQGTVGAENPQGNHTQKCNRLLERRLYSKQVVKEQEEEVYIIGSKVSMPTARKVEKKMAGRGR